jgi:hypothetical protein
LPGEVRVKAELLSRVELGTRVSRVTAWVSRVKSEQGKIPIPSWVSLTPFLELVSWVRGLTGLVQLGQVKPYPLTRFGLAFRLENLL